MPEEAKQYRPGQFLPGQSGNPGGRRKGSISLKALLRKILAEVDNDPHDGKRRSRAEAFVRSRVRLACQGDRFAAREVWEYLEGEPAPSSEQVQDVESSGLTELTKILQISRARLQASPPEAEPKPEDDDGV